MFSDPVAPAWGSIHEGPRLRLVLPDGEARVVRFEGWEGLNELFRFEIIAVTRDPLDPSTILGQRLEFHMGHSSTVESEGRVIVGIAAEVGETGAGKNEFVYRITLVPALFVTTLLVDIRTFREMAIGDIIKTVAGVAPHRIELQEEHLERPYWAQYRETNWAFLSRRLEDEGIYLCYEDDADGTAVFRDRSTGAPTIAGSTELVFRPGLGSLVSDEHVSKFEQDWSLRSNKVSLASMFDARGGPGAPFQHSAQTGDGFWEVYPGLRHVTSGAPTGADVGQGMQKEADHGDAVVKRMLERETAGSVVGRGESNCARFAPGRIFTLAEHPNEDFNRPYLITHVQHSGYEPSMHDIRVADEPRYTNRFQVIPADVSYRPAVVAPRPTLRGVESAVVTGPQGIEIFTDALGRVLVQFQWDRDGKFDEQSSFWVPVSRSWAGAGVGAFFLPRVGHEVLIAFIDGDPDRPIVIGSLHHLNNPPPHPLPQNATVSTIRTLTSPGGGGYNELRFEDKKGKEEIHLHGQRDLTIKILNDKAQEIDRHETLTVGGDRSKLIKKEQKERVEGNDSTEVVGNRTETIQGLETVTIQKDAARTVNGGQTIKVAKGYKLDVGEGLDLGVTKDQVISVGGKQSTTVTGDASETVGGKATTDVTGQFVLTVHGDAAIAFNAESIEEVGKSKAVDVVQDSREKVGKNKILVVGEKLSIEVGAAKLTITKNGNVVLEGMNVEVKANGKVDVKAAATVQLKGAAVGIN